MQDISLLYRKWMRAGSLISFLLLILGLIMHVTLSENGSREFHWLSGYSYLIAGIVILLATPLAGLIVFFVDNFKRREYPMALFVFILFMLLISGAWLIHPGN